LTKNAARASQKSLLKKQKEEKNAVHATTRGHTVFYFHPIDISTEKFPEVGKGRPLYWVIKGKVVEKRISLLFYKVWLHYL
jgi:hypothetical protein